MYKKSPKRKDFNTGRKVQRNSPPPPSSSPISTSAPLLSPHNSHSSPQIPQSIQKSIQQSTQQSSPSMFDSIKQGFGFGIGSSIAHKAVNSIFNSNDKKENTNTYTNTIKVDKDYNLIENKIYDLYNKCLEDKNNDIECNHILQKK